MIKRLTNKLAKGSSAKSGSRSRSSSSSKSVSKKSLKDMSQEELNYLIAMKAYELFEKRGYSHGDDQADWYKAERAVMRTLKK